MKWLVLVVPAALAVDLSSMLQVEVASSAEFGMAIDNIESQIANLNIPGQSNRMAINALMKTLGKSDKMLDDDSIAVLNQVIEVLQNTSGVFAASRAGWQQDMDGSIATTTECNTQWTAYVTRMENNFDIAVGDQNTCRIEHQTLVEMRDAACDAALTAGRSQRPSCEFDHDIPVRHDNGTIWVVKTKEAMETVKDQLRAAAVFFQNKVATVSPLFEICKTYVGEEVTKKTDCDSEQVNADSHYCIWQHGNQEMCAQRTTCIAAAVIDHNDKWAELSALAETSAKEACFIKHVICLVRALINGSTDPDVCNGDGYLSDWRTQCGDLLLVEPDTPVATACDLSETAHGVGEVAYFQMHYQNYSNYSQRVVPSVPCPSLPDLSVDDKFN